MSKFMNEPEDDKIKKLLKDIFEADKIIEKLDNKIITCKDKERELENIIDKNNESVEIEKFINKNDRNKTEFPSKRNFVDRAIMILLEEKGIDLGK